MERPKWMAGSPVWQSRVFIAASRSPSTLYLEGGGSEEGVVGEVVGMRRSPTEASAEPRSDVWEAPRGDQRVDSLINSIRLPMFVSSMKV